MQNKKKVLIIDDDEMHLYTTKGLLESECVEVTTHKSWQGATNRLRELQPDLVLLDINMPGLSGDTLADIIKRYCDSMKTAIFFYSSNDEDSLRELVKIKGVQGYISKGNITDLRDKVNQYLSLPAGSTGGFSALKSFERE